MAAQLTATNGPPRRAPVSWMVFAASSFPVPLSPAMKTGASVSRIFSIMARTRRTDGASPRKAPRPEASGGRGPSSAGPPSLPFFRR